MTCHCFSLPLPDAEMLQWGRVLCPDNWHDRQGFLWDLLCDVYIKTQCVCTFLDGTDRRYLYSFLPFNIQAKQLSLMRQTGLVKNQPILKAVPFSQDQNGFVFKAPESQNSHRRTTGPPTSSSLKHQDRDVRRERCLGHKWCPNEPEQ